MRYPVVRWDSRVVFRVVILLFDIKSTLRSVGGFKFVLAEPHQMQPLPPLPLGYAVPNKGFIFCSYFAYGWNPLFLFNAMQELSKNLLCVTMDIFLCGKSYLQSSGLALYVLTMPRQPSFQFHFGLCAVKTSLDL